MNKVLDEHLIKEPNQKRAKKIFFILILLMIASIISVLASWNDIKSIIVSGPLVSIIGAFLVLFSYKQADRVSLAIGLIPISLSSLWLTIIELYNLSPSDSTFMIPLSLSIGFLVMLFLASRIFLE